MGRMDSEVNLYCRKVLIQAKAKGLFPDWLRFLKGVVDTGSVVFFLTFIAFGLFMTQRVVDSNRWR